MSTLRPLLPRALATAVAVVALAGALVLGAPAGSASAASAGSSDLLATAAVEALQGLVGLRVTTGDAQADAPRRAAAAEHYDDERADLVALVAARSSADAATLDAVWRAASDQRMVAVYSALSQVGVPYRRYRAVPGAGFDCSGLTSWAWGQAGVGLAHSSRSQIGAAARIGAGDVQPGDLVYNPGHVVMALGAGPAIVEAPHTGALVRVRDWKTNRTLRFGDPLR